MKQNAYIAGVGMTHFSKHIIRGLKSLIIEAVDTALKDASIPAKELEAAYIGNANDINAGKACEQGEVALREMGINQIPIINVGGTSSSTSATFNQATTMVTTGIYDIVLVTGSQKIYHSYKRQHLQLSIETADAENLKNVVEQQYILSSETGSIKLDLGYTDQISPFMDIYAAMALEHMKEYGTTQTQFAAVAAKNSYHGSLNPRSQYHDAISIEEVLSAPEIIYPLTRPMCSPISDGAAAVILVSGRKAKQLGLKDPIKVVSSVLRSSQDYSAENKCLVAESCAMEAYEEAGLGPQDLDCIELHDATAPSELIFYEHLGLCDKGEGGRMIEEGQTKLGGRIPVNTSGGGLCKGHLIGASGVAQIVELTEQLRGRAGKRQIAGARIGMAENGGSIIGDDAIAINILSK